MPWLTSTEHVFIILIKVLLVYVFFLLLYSLHAKLYNHRLYDLCKLYFDVFEKWLLYNLK